MSSSINPSIEVKFVVNDRYARELRIGLSDTIFDVKLKLNKAIFMSVCLQRLSYRGIVLEDNQTVQSYAIAPNSIIKLESFDPYQGKKPDKVQVFLKLPPPIQPFSVPITVNLNTDHVMHIKQRLLQAIPGLPIDRVELYQYDGKLKLEDDAHIGHYFLLDGFEIDVIIKPPRSQSGSSPSKSKPPLPQSSSLPSKNKPPLLPSSSLPSKNKQTLPPSRSSRSNKMMIKVLTWCKTKLHVEVNATDKVQVLKDELRKLQATARFELSEDGYFFIHKQRVLTDHESFLNNGVREGDELEIFNGTVSY